MREFLLRLFPKRLWSDKDIKELAKDLQGVEVKTDVPIDQFSKEMPKQIRAIVSGETLVNMKDYLATIPILHELVMKDLCKAVLFEYYEFMYVLPIEDLLLHINHEDIGVRTIIQWRFRMGR